MLAAGLCCFSGPGSLVSRAPLSPFCPRRAYVEPYVLPRVKITVSGWARGSLPQPVHLLAGSGRVVPGCPGAPGLPATRGLPEDGCKPMLFALWQGPGGDNPLPDRRENEHVAPWLCPAAPVSGLSADALHIVAERPSGTLFRLGQFGLRPPAKPGGPG